MIYTYVFEEKYIFLSLVPVLQINSCMHGGFHYDT